MRQLLREYEDFENFPGNQLEFLRKQQVILQKLIHFQNKIPIVDMNLAEETRKNREAIDHFLKTRKSEEIAISHISDNLDINEHKDEVKKIVVKFSAHRQTLFLQWEKELKKVNRVYKILGFIFLIFPPI